MHTYNMKPHFGFDAFHGFSLKEFFGTVFKGMVKAREKKAQSIIVDSLRRQSDAELNRLGFSNSDIAVLRQGKFVLPRK